MVQPVIGVALVAIVAAMLLVRVGWGGQRGGASLGWAITVAALTVLVAGDGAWGLAMGITTAITVALALVLHAGATSPPHITRPAREAPAIHVPHHARDIARRLAVFALVVPVAFVAAQAFAFGLQALARGAGWDEANSTVLALFLQPILWAAIMVVQMTRPHAKQMVAAPVVAALAGLLCWSVA